MLKIHIGTSNFRQLVMESDFVIDKSLFIKEVIDNNHAAMIIIRPRRWGKSTNLDMLKRFLNIEVDENYEIKDVNSNKILFKGGELKNGKESKKLLPLEISKVDEGNIMDRQGTEPVILLNLKECKGNNIEEAMNSIKTHIQELYEDYAYLSESSKLIVSSKRRFLNHLEGVFIDDQLKHSLKFLAKCLYKHYNKAVWLLVDEHDKPGSHFLTLGNYKGLVEDRKVITSFITSMISNCAKDSEFVKKTILTGVTDFIVRDEGSGFNNVSEIYDLNNMNFSNYYGLTDKEVRDLLDKAGYHGEDKENLFLQLKEWYDGYETKDHENNLIYKYNIWSVINHVNKVMSEGIEVTPISYWSNSAMNDIFENISNLGADNDFISLLFRLSRGEEVKLPIPDRDFSFMGNIDNNNAKSMLVSYLLIHYGYLNEKEGSLKIPNKEIEKYFNDRILQIWLAKQLDGCVIDESYNINHLGHDLCQNLYNTTMFLEILRDKLINKIQKGEKSEMYFQSIIGGAIELYSLYNNQSAKYYTGIEKTIGKRGRIDNIFYPLINNEEPSNSVIIHEYKKLDKTDGKHEEMLESAIWQAFEKNYMSEPLAKLSVHPKKYFFKTICIRGVLLIKDVNGEAWNVQIGEKDIELNQATKIVEFMQNKKVIEILQLGNKSRNAEKIKNSFFDKLNISHVSNFVDLFEEKTNIDDLIYKIGENSNKRKYNEFNPENDNQGASSDYIGSNTHEVLQEQTDLDNLLGDNVEFVNQ